MRNFKIIPTAAINPKKGKTSRNTKGQEPYFIVRKIQQQPHNHDIKMVLVEKGGE